MIRSDDVLMKKRACEILRAVGSFGRYLCIWRCQNKSDRRKERGNIVKESLDGFWALGSLRFRLYLVLRDEFL